MHIVRHLLNTSQLTESYISFTLKLQSGQKICINWSFSSSTYGKQKISHFPPCGKGKREGSKIASIVYQFHYQMFLLCRSYSFDSSVSRASDFKPKGSWYETRRRQELFLCKFFFQCTTYVLNLSPFRFPFPHGGKSEIFCLPYVLDLIQLLKQKFCPDPKLRVKKVYE